MTKVRINKARIRKNKEDNGDGDAKKPANKAQDERYEDFLSNALVGDGFNQIINGKGEDVDKVEIVEKKENKIKTELEKPLESVQNLQHDDFLSDLDEEEFFYYIFNEVVDLQNHVNRLRMHLNRWDQRKYREHPGRLVVKIDENVMDKLDREKFTFNKGTLPGAVSMKLKDVLQHHKKT